MLKVSQLMRVNVYQAKRDTGADPASLGIDDLSLVGSVRQVVFAPQGDRVVGLLARRPDMAKMIRRPDAFVALDAIVANDYGLVTTRGDESLDEAARERLCLDWDACIMWTGMDAKTTDGKELGWVDDVEFSPKSGRVKAFYIGDGSVAKSLVGNVVIPGDMLKGYRDGYMVVDPAAAALSLDGGLAARAGEGYARAKHEAKESVDKGAFELGRMLGKASKRLGRTRGMFGSFVDEYKKASK